MYMREVINKLRLFVARKTYRKACSLQLSNKKADLTFTATGVLTGSFILSFIAGSFLLQPHGSEAVTGLGLAEASTLALNSSSSSVNMEIIPSSGGMLTSGSHTLTANTNVPTGYSLSLNTTTATNNLTASTGTIAVPVALSNNTWGFALNGVTSSTSANTVTNGFDASYATPTPSTASKWANPGTSTTIILCTTVQKRI